MHEEEKLTSNSGVGGGELGADDRPVRLCHLQLGGEALRPLGLLGVVLAGLVFLSEQLADLLASVLVDTVEGALRLGGVWRQRFVVST